MEEEEEEEERRRAEARGGAAGGQRVWHKMVFYDRLYPGYLLLLIIQLTMIPIRTLQLFCYSPKSGSQV